MSIEQAVGNENSERPTQIRRGRIPSFAIYEVTDYELKVLDEGTSASLELNFSLVLLSSSLSFVITLCSAQMSNTTETIFKILALVFLFVGMHLIFRWYKSRSNVGALLSEIRARIPANESGSPKEQSE